jgi:hypothetical protein
MTFDTIRTDDVPIMLSGETASRQPIPSSRGFTTMLTIAQAWLTMNLAEDLTLERLCCPFLRLEMDVLPKLGPVWLRMTGREGTKELLRRSFEESDLIDAAVAQQAGLRIDRRRVIDTVESGIAAAAEVNRMQGTAPTSA